MSNPREDSPAEKDPLRRVHAKRRRQMIEEQLRPRGIVDERVLRAMEMVPREEFVAPEYREDAYNDSPLPIGYGQTISQPYTVAFLAESLGLTGKEKVLDVGTGSGYQAAVLSHLARTVHTVERIPELAEQAQETLGRLGYGNIYVHVANGTLGLPGEGPFDAIVAAASSDTLPEPYVEQLAEGGRIVIPLGPNSLAQKLYRFTKRNGQMDAEDLGGFRFVPLIGKYGWEGP